VGDWPLVLLIAAMVLVFCLQSDTWMEIVDKLTILVGLFLMLVTILGVVIAQGV